MSFSVSDCLVSSRSQSGGILRSVHKLNKVQSQCMCFSSYLHCEWRTAEELELGDRRAPAKLRRYRQKKSMQSDYVLQVQSTWLSLTDVITGPIPWRLQTMTATRYSRMATAMKTWKTNGALLRNRQIHDGVGHNSPSYVFGWLSWLWPSWLWRSQSLFVAIIVEPPITLM